MRAQSSDGRRIVSTGEASSPGPQIALSSIGTDDEAGGHEEEDLEEDLRAIRVDGDGEEEDLEEVPGAAREGLTSGDEVRGRIEVGVIDGLGGRHGDAEAGRTGEVGKIAEDTIAESIRAAVNTDEFEALERIEGIGRARKGRHQATSL